MVTVVENVSARKDFNLSEREIEVLRCLAAGQIIMQVATRMGISRNTVKFHLGRIYTKLDVRTQAGAVAKSIYNGII